MVLDFLNIDCKMFTLLRKRCSTNIYYSKIKFVFVVINKILKKNTNLVVFCIYFFNSSEIQNIKEGYQGGLFLCSIQHVY